MSRTVQVIHQLLSVINGKLVAGLFERSTVVCFQPLPSYTYCAILTDLTSVCNPTSLLFWEGLPVMRNGRLIVTPTSSLGNAKILNSNTGDDILQTNNITSYEFTIALMLFLVAYSVFEVPSNLALKVFSPRRQVWSRRDNRGLRRSLY